MYTYRHTHTHTYRYIRSKIDEQTPGLWCFPEEPEL